MSAHGFFKLVHVAIAVLGLGGITAMAWTARGPNPAPLASLQSLGRIAGVSLGLDFLTGALIDVSSKGAFHEQAWFRVAGISMFFAGGAIGYAQRGLRRARAGKLPEEAARTRARRGAVAACAIIAFIVYLMERRPFS
jgi:hypothetical protein